MGRGSMMRSFRAFIALVTLLALFLSSPFGPSPRAGAVFDKQWTISFDNSPQSAQINHAYAQNLQVTIGLATNPHSHPSGVVVTFTAPPSGASGTFANGTTSTTATSGGGGLATASVFTANGTAGQFQVTASTTD